MLVAQTLRNMVLASSFFSSAATTLGFYLLNNLQFYTSQMNSTLKLIQNMTLIVLLFMSFSAFSFCITYTGYLSFAMNSKDMSDYKIGIKKYFNHKYKEESNDLVKTTRFGTLDSKKVENIHFVVRYTIACTISYSLGMRFLFLLPSVGLWMAYGPYAMIVVTFVTLFVLGIHDFI